MPVLSSISAGFLKPIDKSERGAAPYWLILPSIYTLFSFFQLKRFSFDWPRLDDFVSIVTFRDFVFTHSLTFMDLVRFSNGSHPVGVQSILTTAIFWLFGVSIINVIYVNFILIVCTGMGLSLYVNGLCRIRLTQFIAPAAIIAVLLHPVQASHFTWAYEMGWFVCNAILVANVVILERFRHSGVTAVTVLLFIASFASAQGVALWGSALVHVALLDPFRRRPLVLGALACGLILNAIAIAHITPTNESTEGSASLAALIPYLVSLTGAIFASRNTAQLLILGSVMTSICTAIVAIALFKRERTSLERMAAVLIVATAGFLCFFAAGRFRNGLPWALLAFHMAPLLVPMMLGVVLSGLHFCQVASHQTLGRVVGVTMIVLVAASILSSLPVMRAWSTDMRTKQAFAMHVTCNDGYSPYVVASANSATPSWYGKLLEMKPLLTPLCTSKEPWQAIALEQMPALFLDQIRDRTNRREALARLWDVYTTRFDLQSFIPASEPKKLLAFARSNAEAGSPFSRDELEPYARVFMDLDKN